MSSINQDEREEAHLVQDDGQRYATASIGMDPESHGDENLQNESEHSVLIDIDIDNVIPKTFAFILADNSLCVIHLQ